MFCSLSLTSFLKFQCLIHFSQFISPVLTLLGFPGGSDSKKKKNLPAMQGTRVQSLGQEDPLEKGMANHSRILAWKIPWTEKPGEHSPIGYKPIVLGFLLLLFLFLFDLLAFSHP